MEQPNFRSPEFLREHIKSIINFYQQAKDDQGGFHHNYFDNGDVFDAGNKHLVSSCRMIFNFEQ
ncbi:MAG: mannose/cellobiose epimerase-like protein (N-acyl-D-glucosamine 2-epimerase family), partial [Reinekea sp.]